MVIVEVASTVLNILVPGAGTVVEVLRQIYDLSCEIQEGQAASKRAHERLNDICNELQKMEAANRLPPSDALDRYIATLGKSLTYLKKYSRKSFVFRMIDHQNMMDEVRQLHEDIDALMTIFNLAANNAMMQWKAEWEEERVAQMALLTCIDEKSDLVLSKLQSQTEMQEAMFLLLKKLETTDFSAGTKHSATKMLDVIVRASGVGVPKVPKWFIPQDDLD